MRYTIGTAAHDGRVIAEHHSEIEQIGDALTANDLDIGPQVCHRGFLLERIGQR
jgi:hypothetical protein